ncbi:MAG: hypothetical protein JW787_13595 [Sedimentisphaerales bacterium]|nr:hypothetical protein [Sedimentisphaerales bacterium]
MAEWEINKPIGQCSGSGKTIQYGEEYFGALVQSPEGLKRCDFCQDYWQSAKPEVFCFWKTKLPNPDQKKRIFVDDNMLMAFFERLANETEQEKINFRFVLALILMRKRFFKYDETKNVDDKEIWRLRVVGDSTKEKVDVINPHLNEEQIEQLSNQLGEILQTDL